MPCHYIWQILEKRNVKELTSNIADFDRDIPAAVWDALEESGLVNRIEL